MKIAVIGCGHMASKVVEGLYHSDTQLQFYTYSPGLINAKELANKVHGVYVEELLDFNYDDIDFWLIGCKPQQVNDLAHNIQGKLKNKKIISMLASTTLEKLSDLFDSNDILRIMPNTPIEFGLGVTLVYGMVSEFDDLLTKTSYLIRTHSEKELDELTVFSGSGPAYIFYFAHSLEKKLLTMGYDDVMSRHLLNHLFTGAAALMRHSKEDMTTLISQVTSKGGVTIEAIKHFELHQLESITSEAIDKALARSKQMTQDLG